MERFFQLLQLELPLNERRQRQQLVFELINNSITQLFLILVEVRNVIGNKSKSSIRYVPICIFCIYIDKRIAIAVDYYYYYYY